MTHPERIESIRKRLRAATPGPYIVELDADPFFPVHEFGTKDFVIGKTFWTEDAQGKFDADLIANAPADLEYLITKLEVAVAVLAKISKNRKLLRSEGAIYCGSPTKSAIMAEEALQKIEGGMK